MHKFKTLTLVVLVVFIFTSCLVYANEGTGSTATTAAEKQKKTSNPLCMASEKESAIDLFLIAMLLPGVLLFIYLLHRLHVHWFPESIGVVFIGVIIGLIFRFAIPSKLYVVTQLDPKIFFVIFLPAIIFDAGYTLDKGDFFRNIGSIVLYAFAGTVISTIIVASGIYLTGQFGISTELSIVEAFMYGSLISAVDPVATLAIFSALKVNPTLHYLVFGESVVNDAVAIVLFEYGEMFYNFFFRTFEKFQHDTGNTGLLILQALIQFLLNSVGSVIVGVIFALLAALFFKFFNVRNVYYIEIAFFALFAYIPYLITLPFLSGIMCIMTSGIVMSYYVTPNLSQRSADAIAAACRTISFISETAVFVYMGMAVFTFTLHFDWILFLLVIALCMIGRFFNIVPLTRIVNFYRSEAIAYRDQFIMWFSGLRGAIAFALAVGWKRESMTGEILFSTTLLTVLFTIIVFGGLTFPLLKLLRVKTADQMEMTKTEQTNHIVDPEKYWTQVMKERQQHQNVLTKLDEVVMRKIFLRSDAIPVGVVPAVVADSKGLSHLEKYWEGDKEKDDVDDIELQLQDSSSILKATSTENDPSALAKTLTEDKIKMYEQAIAMFKKNNSATPEKPQQ